MPTRNELILGIVLLCTIVIGVVMYMLRQPQEQPLQFNVKATNTPLVAGSSPTLVLVSPTPKMLLVDVAGAVNSPGVYTLTEGARIEDALQAAGGLSDDADVDHIPFSRAAVVKDEQKIIVPRKGSTPLAEEQKNSVALVPTLPPQQSGQESSLPSGKVNINTASKDQLIAVKGIGDKTAEKIITRRTSQGTFTSTQQLLDEKIVTSKNWELMKEEITI